MGRKQFFGIKYPFSNDSEDKYYIDLNGSKKEEVQSELLHIIFTPKGQKLRDPEFGTDLIKFIFQPNDGMTSDGIMEEIKGAVRRYLPDVTFNGLVIYDGEEHTKIVSIDYSVHTGNTVERNNVSLKI